MFIIFSLDIEEITQKAGSYKKFEVFQKMLFSALDKDSDSVFIDLLTFTDLEILKARRNNNVSTQDSSQSPRTQVAEPTKAQLKRYIILTYSSQFDRVHYPLPLNYEEIPNPHSLLKVIKRLRSELNQVHDISNHNNTDSTSMISLTKVITQLRKENEELGQKLRFYESNQQQQQTLIDGKVVNMNTADLITINKKLRNQLDTMKKDLKDMTVAYEQLRSSSMKEILELKFNLEQYTTGIKKGSNHKNMSSNTSLSSHTSNHLDRSIKGKSHSEVRTLKNKIATLERELKIEKLNNSKLSLDNSSSSSKRGMSASVSVTNTRYRSPLSVQSRTPDSLGSRRGSPSTHLHDNTARRPSPSSYVYEQTYRRSPSNRHVHPVSSDSRLSNVDIHGRSRSRPSSSQYNNHSSSSSQYGIAQGSRTGTPSYRSRSRSASPVVAPPRKAWGAGSPLRNRSSGGESDTGYMSAGSQSSLGSQRSHRSAASSTVSARRTSSPLTGTNGSHIPTTRTRKSSTSHTHNHTHSTTIPPPRRSSSPYTQEKQTHVHSTKQALSKQQAPSSNQIHRQPKDVRIIRHVPIDDDINNSSHLGSINHNNTNTSIQVHNNTSFLSNNTPSIDSYGRNGMNQIPPPHNNINVGMSIRESLKEKDHDALLNFINQQKQQQPTISTTTKSSTSTDQHAYTHRRNMTDHNHHDNKQHRDSEEDQGRLQEHDGDELSALDKRISTLKSILYNSR